VGHERRGPFAGAGYGMGWWSGPWGGVPARMVTGDWFHAHAGMFLLPEARTGGFVMFNVGLHGTVLAGLLAIEQSVAGLLAGGVTRDTGVRRFYLVFDAAVAAVLALQAGSLARLLRRPGGHPRRPRDLTRLPPERRHGLLTALRDVGVPTAVAVLPPVIFRVPWKGLRLYGPDVAWALIAAGGLSAATGVVRALTRARPRSTATRSPAPPRRRR
jgi:hypothetical protein